MMIALESPFGTFDKHKLMQFLEAWPNGRHQPVKMDLSGPEQNDQQVTRSTDGNKLADRTSVTHSAT
jgi:hypothetical protein